MSANPRTPANDASRCPLCGGANDCQRCSPGADKGPCWCERVRIPETLLARVPAEWRHRACLCQKCVAQHHQTEKSIKPTPVLPGDFYYESGRVVFTGGFLTRRGYCCGSGCRHCPY